MKDKSFGFHIIPADALERKGVTDVVDEIVTRVGDSPVYVSIDIDVLDPAFAPGTGICVLCVCALVFFVCVCVLIELTQNNR